MSCTRFRHASFSDICDFLDEEVILFTGGRDFGGKYYFIFTRTKGKWSEMSRDDYCKLIAYFIQTLNLLFSEVEPLELSILIDARFIKPSDLKELLSQIKGYFPAIISQVIVIKPDDPIQNFKNLLNSISYSKMEMLPIKTCKNLESLNEYFPSSQLPVDFGGLHNFDFKKWRKNQLLTEQFAMSVHQLIRALTSAQHNYKLMSLPVKNWQDLDSIVSQQRVCKANLVVQLEQSAESEEAILNCICNKDDPGGALRDSYELPPDQRLHLDIIRHVIIDRTECESKFKAFWITHDVLLSKALELSRFYKNYEGMNETASKLAGDLQALSLYNPSDPDSVQHSFNAMQDLENKPTLHDLQSQSAQLLESLQQIETEYFTSKEENENSEIVEPSSLISLPSMVYTNTYIDCDDNDGDSSEQRDCIWDARYVRFDYLVDLHQNLSSQLSSLEIDVSNCKEKLCKFKEFHQLMSEAEEWCNTVNDFLNRNENAFNTTSEILPIQCLLNQISAYEESRTNLNTLLHPKEFKNNFGDLLNQDLNSLVHEQLTEMENASQKLELLKKRLSDVVSELQSRHMVEQVDDTISLQSFGDTDKSSNFSDTTSIDSHTLSDETYCSKLQCTIQEFIDTERAYTHMLTSIYRTFWNAMDDPDNAEIVPKDLLDDRCAVFGNWAEMADFHQNIVLPAIENGISSLQSVGNCFQSNHDQLIDLYSTYCVQLTVAPLNLARMGGDEQPFIKMCRSKLDMELPLSSYLLKPVQRLQKYQLLLQQLIKHSSTDQTNSPVKLSLEAALKTMLKVLDFVNSAMSQSDIRGYKEKLSSLGRLLLHQKFGVWVGRNTNRPSTSGAPKQRHLFLYEKALLLCKQRDQGKNVYDFEKCIQTNEIGITENPNGERLRFVIWTADKSLSLMVHAANESLKSMWTRELNQLLFKQFEMIKQEKLKLSKG